MSADAENQVNDVAASTETIDGRVAWLRSFEKKHGRPLRVLHIGNIANNAYLNAKFLRSVGVDAHVVSYDYQHVMATPEWEEVELIHGHGDDFMPEFSAYDLSGYQRPKWFFSGSIVMCAVDAAEFIAGRTLHLLRVRRLLLKRLVLLTTKLYGSRVGYAVSLLMTDPRLLFYKIWVLLSLKKGVNRHKTNALLYPWGAKKRQYLVALFDQVFPHRSDRLTPEDIFPYQFLTSHFRNLFRHYDLVQCYATEPIHALIADKQPYVAFEHGTLRDFTMGDVPLHRLTALAYRKSDHTFITNGDCLSYAERLDIEKHSPIIHPIDVKKHRQDFGNEVFELRQEIGGDVVLFCPIRHDWDIKGIDVHLRALPLIKGRIGGRLKLVLVGWGMQIGDSKALLKELSCEDDVVWRTSMCRITMIKHMRAADVVLDQMTLPHFGSTAPQSMAAGVPVISSYDPASTAYIIPEPAPILSAFSPTEVAASVVQALDPNWRADYEKRARRWIDKYHHSDNVIDAHLDVYRRLLEN